MRIILAAVFIATLIPEAALAECTCRYRGNDIAEGKTVCMKSPSGTKLARCERVLNNTSWKILEQPCPLVHSNALPTRSTIANQS